MSKIQASINYLLDELHFNLFRFSFAGKFLVLFVKIRIIFMEILFVFFVFFDFKK